tara:strand:- start:61 stop:639 length:579 start_codon:yes stop_codon:yes gene_type:complete
LIKKFILNIKILFYLLILINTSHADIQKDLVNKITATKTLTFNFSQQIGEKMEYGHCFIKYPLLMKCNYEENKQKSVISNGNVVAVIKKKYKKIYYYPIQSTPLSVLLKKEKILNLVRNSQPIQINSNEIIFQLADKKSNIVNIYFDKKTLDLKGWKTKDNYSNDVSFVISNLESNKIIEDSFFKIPKQKDL